MDVIALCFKNQWGLQHILAPNVKAGLRVSVNDKETETNIVRGDGLGACEVWVSSRG